MLARMSPHTTLRADAAANRARILRVAEQCIWAQGLDVSLHAIAAEAGLGPGTLYRHFPDRGALLKGILLSVTEEFDDGMQRASDIPHPYERLRAFLDVAAEINLAHPVLNELWIRVQRDDPGYSVPNSWERIAIETVTEAQAGGYIRADASPTDFALLPRLLSALSSAPESLRRALSDRFISIFLAGLAPDTGAPLVAPTPPSVVEEMLRTRTGT